MTGIEKTTKLALIATAATLFALLPTKASAQDACSDILADGIKKSVAFRQSQYFKQIMESRLATTSFDQASDKSAGGLTALIPSAIFSGSFSRAEYERKQQQVRSSLNVTTIRNNEFQVAMTSGDGIIVDAWKTCMSRQQIGLKMHFSSVSVPARQAYLTVEWMPVAGVVEATIAEDFVLPRDVTINYGAECLRKGKTLRASVPCVVLMTLPGADSDLAVTLRTNRGAASAYLPKRLKLVVERKPANLSGLRTEAGPGKQSRVVFTSNRINAADMAAGWTFETASLKATLTKARAIAGGDCTAFKIERGVDTFSYGFKIKNGKNATTICDVVATGNMIRQRWVAAD